MSVLAPTRKVESTLRELGNGCWFGKVIMTDNEKPTTYFVVEIDKWGTHSIVFRSTHDNISKVRKIRDLKIEETLLMDTDKKYKIGSIQPFL